MRGRAPQLHWDDCLPPRVQGRAPRHRGSRESGACEPITWPIDVAWPSWRYKIASLRASLAATPPQPPQPVCYNTNRMYCPHCGRWLPKTRWTTAQWRHLQPCLTYLERYGCLECTHEITSPQLRNAKVPPPPKVPAPPPPPATIAPAAVRPPPWANIFFTTTDAGLGAWSFRADHRRSDAGRCVGLERALSLTGFSWVWR